MKRISLVFLSLLVIVFISGCTQTSNITGLLQEVPDAVDFLEKHPDTYVTFVEVSNPEKIKNYCNKSVPLKDYLRLRLYDEKTGSELILFLDKQTHQLICKKYNKNHNLINQDPKEKCKELGGDFCSSKNECALPWLNSIEYCCPIPCGTCPETVNCDDKNNCTIDYCIVKKGEPVCIHKEITPCPNNGVCELGEYEGPIDSYCPGEEYAVVSARIKSSDCPKTCDDGNPETGDWYNFTSQKCEHKLCEKKPPIKIFKIGEVASDGKLAITVNRVSFSDKLIYTQIMEIMGEPHTSTFKLKPKDGYQFLILDITIENLLETPTTVSSLLQFKVFDEEGYYYDYSLFGTRYLDKKWEDGDILPKMKRRGKIAFEVPKNVKGLKFAFLFDISRTTAVFDLLEK